MIITIDTSVAISDFDLRILNALINTPLGPEAPVEVEKPKRGRPKKDEPTPEPVGEEPENGSTDAPALASGSSATLQDAVDLATKLVAAGEAEKVREALAAVGARQVSKIADDDVAAFLDALNAA